MAPVFELHDVYRLFALGYRHVPDVLVALENITFQVVEGEFIALVGPSGCGKSTILNLIAGLVPTTYGEVIVDGRHVRGINHAVAYITQDDNLLPWRTVLANVELPLEFRRVSPMERKQIGKRLLREVGLGGFENYYPHQLSGGMRKRVGIVRTLAYEPQIFLMDEPFGPLDAQTRVLLQDQLLRIWEGSGKTVIFVTHDLVEAIALSDRVVVMTRSPGRIKCEIKIDIPRPRDVFHIHSHPRFSALFDLIWDELKEELPPNQVPFEG
jgi:NitT/TauT family transport system ATP-binding protein